MEQLCIWYIHVSLCLIAAVTRIDVGGKLLTNHLKEIISYRQIHVLEETYVMNACKEDSCFVSLDFNEDLKMAFQVSMLQNFYSLAMPAGVFDPGKFSKLA